MWPHWGTSDLWSTLAQVIAAAGSVMAAGVAAYTARQSRQAAQSSAAAATTARRALAMHYAPVGFYILSGQEGETPFMHVQWQGAVPDRGTVVWTDAHGRARATPLQRNGTHGPLEGLIVKRYAVPPDGAISNAFVECAQLSVACDFAGESWVAELPVQEYRLGSDLQTPPALMVETQEVLEFELAGA